MCIALLCSALLCNIRMSLGANDDAFRETSWSEVTFDLSPPIKIHRFLPDFAVCMGATQHLQYV